GSDIVVTVGSVLDPDAEVLTAVAFTNSDWNSIEIGTTGITYKAIAPRPGTSAFAAERYISYDEVHAVVINEATNTVVERVTYLSKLTDAKSPEGNSTYWKDYINEFSRFIYVGSELGLDDQTGTGEPSGGDAASYGATAISPVKLARILPTAGGALTGGVDDFAYDAGEIQAAYDEFLDTESTEVDFVLMGGSMGNEVDTIAKAEAVAAIANSRKDCIAFISPYVGAQVATSGGAALTPAEQLSRTIDFFDNIGSSSYVVLDSGIKYTYDRFNDKYRYIGCNGDVAGLCVSTSAILDDWFSPAGLNRGGLQNVVKLAFNPNKAQRDDLYTSRINPIVSFPGSGPVLFGDKTGLASPSAFDRINVRRLFLNVEKRARALAESVLFEQNDTTTRSGFAASISSYLSEVQARRGLTDFLVICDESNNTPEIIDRNEFVAELYLKPTRSINFVTVTVTATRTGVTFAEVIGR
ncbi:MAG: phage tail sheath C-terminal domain-containing protein, partial [Candidatus Nanopelagicaceae bacterium]